MSRIPLTLRMLVLVPLVAAGVDLTRATVACGPRAQTCLEAAGRGWLGPFAVLLVVVAAAGMGLLLARARPRRRTSFATDWALATTGVTLAVAAQELIARHLSDAPLGGSSLTVLVLCVLGGALVAAAMRAIDVAAGAVTAPRFVPRVPAVLVARRERGRMTVVFADRPRGRGPPAS